MRALLLPLFLVSCASTSGARPVFEYPLTPDCEEEEYGGTNKWHPCDLERSANALVPIAVNGAATDAVFAQTSGRVHIADSVNKTPQHIDGTALASILERGLIESQRGTPVAIETEADVIAQFRFHESPLEDGGIKYYVTLSLRNTSNEEQWSSTFEIPKKARPRPKVTW